jgi:hypothetical protein
MAQSLRVTAFPAAGFEIPEVSWWTVLASEPPETRTLKPRDGSLIEEGTLQQGKLRLIVQPFKIDWHYLVAQPEKVDEGIPSLGSFQNALGIFLPMMKQWVAEMSPKLARLGFGAVLLQPVSDQKAGYEILGQYLPAVDVDPIGSSDFLYRINRPRESMNTMPGLRINRLMTWSVMRVEGHFISSQRLHIQALNLRACRVELDINTSQDYTGELPTAKLPEILEDLVSQAKEIATVGDIP